MQVVSLVVTWDTVLTNFTSGAAFPSLVQGPLAAYINALAIGQEINVFEMNEVFQEAVEGTPDSSLLTRLVFSVLSSGTLVAPGTGTGAITGDPESSFSCLVNAITLVQG